MASHPIAARFRTPAVLLLLFFCFFGTPLQAQAWTVGFLTGSGGLGDESFNDMTYKGLGKAKKYLGIDIEVREWEPNLSMEKLFMELIEKDCMVIVLNGSQFAPLLDEYSSAYPHITFLANDFEAEPYPNVKSIVYSQHEGSFLAGALAGSVSENHKVAFLGAIDIEIVKAFQTGFAEGVKYIAPEAEIIVSYISNIPDYSGFNNPAKGMEMADDLYKKGVDVIFAVAGASGNGIIQAAKKNRKFVIGVDSNQDHMAKSFVLTSVVKRLDVAVYTETIRAFHGTLESGTTWYGLANGGISLTPMEYTRHLIPKSVLQLVEKLKQQIIAGEISVTNSLLSDQ